MPAFGSISTTGWVEQVNTTVTAPSGIVDGNLLLLLVATGALGVPGEAPDPTPPTGFTLLSGPTWPVEATAFDFNIELRIYSKIAASESGDYTITHANGNCQGVIVRYTAPGAFDPAPTANTGAGFTSTALGLTTDTNNTMVIFVEWDFTQTGGTMSPPSGTTPTFTERLDSATAPLYLADGVLATAGATGDKSTTNRNTDVLHPWAGMLIALEPDGSIPPPSFVAAGALSAEASTTALGPVALPTGHTAGDILIMGCMGSQGGTFTGPGDGWVTLGTAVNSANQSSEWFWKRHDGSESDPTVTTSWTMSATLGGYARIWAFRGCIATGDPFEDVTMNGTPTTSTTPASAAIDTTGVNRLAVCFALIDDDPAFSSGNPPALWDLVGTNASSTTGGDALFSAISREMPTAAAVAAVNVGTLPASDYWRTLTLALIPPSGTPAVGPAWRRPRPQLQFR